SKGANRKAPMPRSPAVGRRSPTSSSNNDVPANNPSKMLPRRSVDGRTPPINSVLVAAEDDFLEVLELLENLARPQNDARQRILRAPDVEIGDLAQQQIEASQQRAAAGHEDAAIDDVCRELWRRALERLAQRIDDAADGLLQGFADLDTRHPQRA